MRYFIRQSRLAVIDGRDGYGRICRSGGTSQGWFRPRPGSESTGRRLCVDVGDIRPRAEPLLNGSAPSRLLTTRPGLGGAIRFSRCRLAVCLWFTRRFQPALMISVWRKASCVSSQRKMALSTNPAPLVISGACDTAASGSRAPVTSSRRVRRINSLSLVSPVGVRLCHVSQPAASSR